MSATHFPFMLANRRVRRYQRKQNLPSAFLFVSIFAVTFLGLSHHNLNSVHTSIRESSHPLSPHRSLLRRPEGGDDLAFLSFGDEAYTELLSDTVISEDYLDLAVACAQSIVGDAVEFDAITIPSWSPRNRVLVDRIRKRFPMAVIVLVELPPDLAKLTLYPTAETFSDWRTSAVVESTKEQIAQEMIDHANAIQGHWIWGPRNNEEDKRLLERRRSDPLLVTYRLDPTFLSVPDAVDFLNLYDEQDALSQLGHHKVANDIRNLVQLTLDRTVKVRKDRQMQSNLKSWGTGDDCHLWLVSGDYPPSTAQSVVLPQTNWHMHALEFRKSHNDSISVHNPFPSERMLFLTYLTDSDSMAYSTTRVFINGKPTVQIQPFHDHAKDIHLARTAGVGLVPPGMSTIVLEPMTPGLPFRLVGASILAQEAMELTDVEFELEREHVVNMPEDDVASSVLRLFRR